jgi:hypothetical protein
MVQNSSSIAALDFKTLWQLKAVRVGFLVYPPEQVETLLQRYCKHIFVLNDMVEYPYTFRGSGTALRFGNEHFVFCCAHQFPDAVPDRIAIRPAADETKIITASVMHLPTVSDENENSDYIDARGFQFHVENYDMGGLSSDFLSVDATMLWPANDRGMFLILGYPSELQDVDYERPGVVARIAIVNGVYDGPSQSPYVHRLRMQRTRQFDPDGLSGGPVFYLGGDAGSYFIGFAGMVIRGSAGSEILHFIEADFLRHFAQRVPLRP